MGKVRMGRGIWPVDLFLYTVIITVSVFSFITCSSGSGEGDTIPVPTIFVDASAPTGGDGNSWATAYKYLQDGLAASSNGDVIGVAQGVYYPDEDEGGNVVSDSDTQSFTILDGVKVYGGFSTGGASYGSDTYITVLSGDIDQDDATDSEGITLKESDLSGDNSNHVVLVQNVTSATLLDGVTICGGDNDDAFSFGGGLYCLSSLGNECSPLVQDVVFCGNRAAEGGAVVFHMAVSGGTYNARFVNVTFQYNTATGDGGAMSITGSDIGYNGTNNITLARVTFSQNTAGTNGGGLFDDARGGTSNMKIANATFTGNTAGFGGAISSYFHLGAENNQYIVNSVFNGNSADTAGGALCYQSTAAGGRIESLMLVNVVCSGNNSSSAGGALYYSTYQASSGNPSFVNVTFASNTASSEGGAIWTYLSVVPDLMNCILWGNAANTGAQVFNQSATLPIFYYCMVEDSIPGTDGGSNSTADPLFQRTPSSGDGNWTTLSDNDYGDLHLQTTPSMSPGIDSGSNSALPVDKADLDGDGNTSEQLPYDLDEEQRIKNSTVDRGAYEH